MGSHFILQLYTNMNLIFSQQIREFLIVAREREGESRVTLLGGAFRKAKYEKLRRRKSEGGAGIHFPQPSMRKLNKVLLCGMVKVEDAECLPSTCRL